MKEITLTERKNYCREWSSVYKLGKEVFRKNIKIKEREGKKIKANRSFYHPMNM